MPLLELQYRPYDDVATEPNVIVDGRATGGTTLTLSHWPGSGPVPPDVEADLSAQMAFRYLDHPEVLHGAATVVSNNHFDQDGLVSIFALSHPHEAMARRSVLEDLAAAGDFATFTDRTAARASMVVAAFADPERTPLGVLPSDASHTTALLYTELLGRLPELVDDIGRYRVLWEQEDHDLTASERALAAGTVHIEEHADVDLAVVTIDTTDRWSGHRFSHRRHDGIHPMALHNATRRTVVLLIADDTYRLAYRYETWVQFRSRPLPRRVDLAPLAEELSAADDVPWSADPVDNLTPAMAPAGGSSLPPAQVIGAVRRHLRTAPPAFDPFVPLQRR